MKNRPSGTAEGIAFMRCYESLRPPAQRICNGILSINPGFKAEGTEWHEQVNQGSGRQ